MIKRILCGLAGTQYTPAAIRTAVAMALRHDSEVTGVTVVDEARLDDVGPVPAGAEIAASELREHRRVVTAQTVARAVEDFRELCGAAGVKHSVRQEQGDSFSLLSSLSRYHDVMIFGLRGIFDHGLHSDPPHLIAKLISEGIRPVVAVSTEFREVRRVLMAYSGSMESAKTIRRFCQLRPWSDVELKVVTYDQPEARAGELLDDMSAYCRAHGFDPILEHQASPARDALLQNAAAWDADLIILGNSARSLLLRRVMGETALHVIRNADRPLFLSQ